MTVIVNDWRGRNPPAHRVDAMIHDQNCHSIPANWMDRPYWRLYPSLEEAEADIGDLAFTHQFARCLRGHGRAYHR